MTERQPYFLTAELMEILNTINDKISLINDRLTRIEAQDHHDGIKTLRNALDKEVEKRTALELKVSNLQNKVAPIVFGVTLAAAGLVEFIFTRLHLSMN